MTKHIRFIPALALGMVVSMPTLATAAIVTLNVVDPATLIAKGAGGLVSVQVTCDPSFGSGSQVFGSVNLTERVGNKVANGSGGFPFGPDPTAITCDGKPQTFQIVTTSMSLRFRSGLALAQASLFVSSPILAGSAQVTQQIHFVNK
jgi:hypothetical protein